MEVNESQKDGYRSTDPRPPDPDTVVCKAAIKVKYEKQKKNRTAYRAVRIITQSIRPRCRQGAGIFLGVSD